MYYCTVTGKVIDEVTGKGIKGVNVRISFSSGSRTVLTDDNGDFRSTDVEPGVLALSRKKMYKSGL